MFSRHAPFGNWARDDDTSAPAAIAFEMTNARQRVASFVYLARFCSLKFKGLGWRMAARRPATRELRTSTRIHSVFITER